MLSVKVKAHASPSAFEVNFATFYEELELLKLGLGTISKAGLEWLL